MQLSSFCDTISLPFTTPKLYLNFLFLVQFLPLFIFYSFDYTVKSGGVYNWLPVPKLAPPYDSPPCDSPPCFLPSYILLFISITYYRLSSAVYSGYYRHRRQPFAPYFIYISHSISIALQLSCLINSIYCKSLHKLI